MTSTQHHRALAGATRSRLLAILRAAERPLGIRELANAVALHPNTIREHLQLLEDAGLVRREAVSSGGRGRPAIRFHLQPDALAAEGRPYATLSRVLADQLAELPNAATAARRAGRRWGAAMAADAPPAATPEAATEQIVKLLDEAGFAPEMPVDTGTTIRLRNCPFGTLAVGREPIICGVHLGLMQGALRAMAAPLDATGLDPFVTPDLCLAHFAGRSNG
jgi:predicted ArsR family transcriptional regulator